VLILGQLLDQYGDDWGKVLPLFSEQRVPDAHALQELSNYSFPRAKLLQVEFFLRLTMGRLFHRWFPHLVKPFVFDLLLHTDLPYSQVLSRDQGWIHKVKRSMAENS
jgi:kynurenine 3-monooxygenase